MGVKGVVGSRTIYRIMSTPFLLLQSVVLCLLLPHDPPGLTPSFRVYRGDFGKLPRVSPLVTVLILEWVVRSDVG